MAMQTMIRKATPHQTSARRCVMVRAMKSLMRMSKPPFNTKWSEDANAAAARRYFGGV
jgi:type IV secretory pathway TrbF-like protein